jgi:hypothetical protein
MGGKMTEWREDDGMGGRWWNGGKMKEWGRFTETESIDWIERMSEWGRVDAIRWRKGADDEGLEGWWNEGRMTDWR